jgi:hypothetical protein
MGGGTYDAAGNPISNPSVVYDSDNRMVVAPGGPLGTVQTYEYAPDNRGWCSGRGTGAATVTLANRVGAGGHGGVTSRSQGRGLWHI